jgi:DNA-binding MarR family transcriptional regulator
MWSGKRIERLVCTNRGISARAQDKIRLEDQQSCRQAIALVPPFDYCRWRYMGAHTITSLAAADPSVRGALDGIRRIVQTLRTSSRTAEQQVGLSGAQLFVLQRLAAEPDLSVNDLAERTLTHQSSVSVVVQRLVDKGLVRRQSAPDDARRAVLKLTARGQGVLKKAPGAAQDRLIAGLLRLSSVERRSLARGLDRLLGAMGEGTGTPPMFFEDPPRRRS